MFELFTFLFGSKVCYVNFPSSAHFSFLSVKFCIQDGVMCIVVSSWLKGNFRSLVVESLLFTEYLMTRGSCKEIAVKPFSMAEPEAHKMKYLTTETEAHLVGMMTEGQHSLLPFVKHQTDGLSIRTANCFAIA